MNDVTTRFLKAYDGLVASKKVTNQSEFCQKLGIRPSVFTEICSGRTGVGLKTLQKFVIFFDVDANFLLKGNVQDDEFVVNESQDQYNSGIVSELKKENRELKAKVRKLNKIIDKIIGEDDDLLTSEPVKSKRRSA